MVMENAGPDPDQKPNFDRFTHGEYIDETIDALYIGWCLHVASSWVPDSDDKGDE
jgi:hypothetical protein